MDALANDTNPPPPQTKAAWWKLWSRPIIGAHRLLGVDVARAIALLGMMGTHLYEPTSPDALLRSWGTGDLTWPYRYFSGTASALFCFLAGVSIAIASGCHGGKEARPGAIGQLIGRAIIIGYLGLLITNDDTRIAVILLYYAVVMLLLVPFVRIPAKFLLPIAGVWTVAAPIVAMSLHTVAPAKEYTQIGFTISQPIDHVGWNLLLTGYYPACTWSAFMLLGLAIGKLDLKSSIVQYAMLGLGAVGTLLGQIGYLSLSAASIPATTDPVVKAPTRYGHWWTGHYGIVPAGWDWQTLPIPHSGTIADVLNCCSKAMLILAVMLILERLLGKHKKLLLPLSATGAMTLTWYCCHIVLHRNGLIDSWSLQVGLFVVASTIIALLLRTRGPLEALTWGAARVGKQASLLLKSDK